MGVIRWSWVVIAAVCSPGTLSGQRAPTRASLDRFASQLESLRGRLHIPGLSAAVAFDGHVVWSAGLGLSDVEAGTAATPDTPYEIASLTKPISAALLMHLVEEGRVSLDDPMSRYSPAAYHSDSVLVRHLLTHTSEGVPGTSYAYSGNLFAGLFDVIVGVSGRRFRELVATDVLSRTGATSSSPGNDLAPGQPNIVALLGAERTAAYAAAVQRLAKPYRLYGSGEIVRTTETLLGLSPANGMISSVMDLARIDSAMDAGAFVAPATLDRMWTNARTNAGDAIPYGLGWFVQQYRGNRLVWHNGNLPDLYSGLWLKLPERRLTLLLLANSDALSSPFALARGNLMRSAFACAFVRDFVVRDADCGPGSDSAMTDWLEARRAGARTAIRMDSATLETYAATFLLPSGNLTLAREGDHLIRRAGSPRWPMFPEAPDTFFTKAPEIRFFFERNADGRMTGVRIVRAGQPDLVAPSVAAEPLFDTLTALERRSWEAWQRRDAAYFQTFLSDDHVEVGSGGVGDKAYVVAGVGSPACVVTSYSVDEFRLTILDERTAVLTYRAEQNTTCGGSAVPSPAWATSVYVRRGDRWRNAVYQQTPARR